MIVIVAFVAGATWGFWLARRRGGALLDRLQYATAFGIAFAVAGLFATVVFERMI
jgi:UPF0716 family protein affecting phage T7 exclusion